MKRKCAVIGLTLLLLSGCGRLKKEDPKPDQAQLTLMEDVSSLLRDLDGFQSSQDDIDDQDLLDN